jgi:hypothetical protein
MNFRPPRVGETSRSQLRARAFRAHARAMIFVGLAFSLAPFFACAESAEGLNPDDAGRLPDSSVLPESALSEDGPMPEDASVDALVPSPCSAGGFCFVPVPVQKPLWAVSGSSVEDVWAISSQGSALTNGHDSLLRWDGATWKVVYQTSFQPTKTKGLYGIWTPKQGDVWAVGEEILRYSERDGIRQLPIPSPLGAGFRFSAGWVTPASDALWGVAGQQEVFRFREEPEGSLVVDRWTPQIGAEDASAYMGYRWSGIWGFGPNDIYVAGRACQSMSCNPSRSAIAHYDGTDWSVTVLDSGRDISSIFGTPPAEPRHLWLTLVSLPGVLPWTNTQLVPVMNDGSVGAPLVTQSLTANTGTGEVRGSAVSPNAAWISNGLFVWRWTGTELELTPTSVNGSSMGKVLGVWTGSDDAWLVGESAYPQTPSATQFGMPTALAALRRGERSTDGGQP